MSKRGRLFIVSGPSGSGKSTVLGEVFKRRDRLYFSVSATTRAPRPGETDGVEYFFLDEERFDQMVERGEFLEHARYAKCSYGTPRGPIEEKLNAGIDVILDIEVQGAKQVKARMPEAVSVFLAPPDLRELERRLRSRGTESEERIALRLETARSELREAEKYDYVVVNDDFRRAAGELLDIIDRSEETEPSKN